MGFSANQLRALRRDVDRRNLRTRQIQNGRELTYIEGWHAIAEANRIFGFDGWDRETLESRCVLAREIRGAFTAIYVARVRIKVRAEGEIIIREGHGTGESKGGHPGEAHDMAIKAAETDATKRALATFGKPFGLALYLHGRSVAPTTEQPLPGQVTERRPQATSVSLPLASLASVQEPSVPSETTKHPITHRLDHERRRTLQRLGTNGRYYVPPRSQPTSDSFHKILANEEAAKRNEATTTSVGGNGQSASAPQNAPTAEKALVSGLDKSAVQKAPGAEITSPDDIRTALAKNTAFLIAHPRRARDKDHLLFVGKQPCLLCGRTPADAHHLRFAQPRAMSKKVSDEFTVPLCRIHHRQLHHAGDEASWWNDMNVDPLPIAQELWQQSHGRNEGEGGGATESTNDDRPSQPATYNGRKTPA